VQKKERNEFLVMMISGDHLAKQVSKLKWITTWRAKIYLDIDRSKLAYFPDHQRVQRYDSFGFALGLVWVTSGVTPL